MPGTQSVAVPAAGARLIHADRGWWFLGAGGYALMRPGQVGPDGTLRPSAERYLREAGLYDVRPYTSYSLTVLTSTDCNLGCGYCFQNTAQDPKGGSRPPRIQHARLTPEAIGQVLDFTRERMDAAGMDRLALLLFGGEPLLNPRGCRDLLTRARELGPLTASMTSNGTLLTPLIAKELNAAGLGSVQVTFDGDRADHDSIRVKRSGGGTFDVIVSNIARAIEKTSLRWMLRVNVSHLNRNGVDELVERLGARLDPARCGIHFARVGDVGVGYANNLMHEDGLVGDFVRWHARALELGFMVARPRAHVPCQACSFSDGRYGAVINADGVLASCWETAGKPGMEVGTLTDGYMTAEQTEGRWVSCHDHYQYDEEAAVRATFQDRVDAGVLDCLNAVGRLG
ncbi:radical SAM protein [Streptomyces sp. P01-B04]|uniref:radical SAM protein n=1 Tax=Streptomyces poriferorum TaxID=2798799 RepID=UPI001C5CE5B0|nr:radical SAM protein [Streptomyces poriferorum]MBW5249077.1 radical SAM protein [Streptomyces poriferorum]MBW5257940.1 radical SAM protein [Streptomyces poriferorum]